MLRYVRFYTLVVFTTEVERKAAGLYSEHWQEFRTAWSSANKGAGGCSASEGTLIRATTLRRRRVVSTPL